jgi:1,4-alpha-glucan branching enzyme
MPLSDAEVQALLDAVCADPFHLLGPHEEDDGQVWVRAWVRHARSVRVVAKAGGEPVALSERCAEGLFEGLVWPASEAQAYELLVTYHGGEEEYRQVDPYAFWPQLDDFDLERFAAGQHHHLEQVLGSHAVEIDGCAGVRFAVWAPNARRVSVVGDWNGFDGRYHPMRKRHPYGVWELFIPGLTPGMAYKYEVLGQDSRVESKADPFARQAEIPPATASIISSPSQHEWTDSDWIADRSQNSWWQKPMAIYEVHIGSWQRGEGDRHLSYRELAPRLVQHCSACGFTHVEFLPLVAHPYEGSWGYQVSGYYAPNSRHGDAEDLKFLVDALHATGIGVLVDFVPAHFPKDGFGLALFDGSPTFEYADPREGEHKEWGTLVFNFKRPEVRNFLLGSALFWVREFHIDGLRVDAVSAMLYRDYNRREGEWVQNEEGGNANLEAMSWLQELNGLMHELFPGVVMVAEESTAWKGTTAPVEWHGLGFDLKWNMGWMHDTLRYLGQDPVMRPGVHDWITFHQWYAYDEKWVLPLSHDEVVHGKGSLLDKGQGDFWQRIATLRLLYGYQAAVPGRILLFQGAEIGQGREWSWQRSLDWHEGAEPERQGLCSWVGKLLHTYREEPALWLKDDDRDGFQWVDVENRKESVLAFLRRAEGHPDVIVVCNFTPIPRTSYPIGVTKAGTWDVLLNSDDEQFGGAGQGPSHHVSTVDESWGDWPAVLRVPLPPLGILFLRAPQD